jgi:hypothetical protein
MVSRAQIPKQIEKSPKPPPGSGKRFKQLVGKLKKSGAEKPKALAAFIGHEKYGAKKMAQMAAKGRRRKS